MVETKVEKLGQLLKDNCLTIATAESCTAGGIANAIASVPGSSKYFIGSVVSYATLIKEKLLNVSEQTIERNNVVSPNVALEMALGAIDLMGADVAISITGVAGPTYVDHIKPGTIYVCVAFRTNKSTTGIDHFVIHNLDYESNDRKANIQQAIEAAIEMACNELENFYLMPSIS